MRRAFSRLPAEIQIIPLQATKRIDIKQVKKMGLFSIVEIIYRKVAVQYSGNYRIPWCEGIHVM